MPHAPAVELRSGKSIGDHDVLAGQGLLSNAPVTPFEEGEGLLKLRRQHGNARRPRSRGTLEPRPGQFARLTERKKKLQQTPAVRGVVGPDRAMAFQIEEILASRSAGTWSHRLSSVMALDNTWRRSAFTAGDQRFGKAHYAAQRVHLERRRVAQLECKRQGILGHFDQGYRSPFFARKSVVAGDLQKPIGCKRPAGAQVLVQIAPVEPDRILECRAPLVRE